MATEAGSPGAAIIEAVMAVAKHEARTYKWNTEMADEHRSQAQTETDVAAAARERYEQATAFLEVHAPDWLKAISEEQRPAYII